MSGISASTLLMIIYEAKRENTQESIVVLHHSTGKSNCHSLNNFVSALDGAILILIKMQVSTVIRPSSGRLEYVAL